VSVPFELGTLDGEPAAAVILALHQVSHRRVCKKIQTGGELSTHVALEAEDTRVELAAEETARVVVAAAGALDARALDATPEAVELIAPAAEAELAPAASKQAELTPDWIATGEEYWTAPLESRIERVMFVPAGRLTVQV
jgi:hypothetical protein